MFVQVQFLTITLIFGRFYENTALNLVVPLSSKKTFVFNRFFAPCSKKEMPLRYENIKFHNTAAPGKKFTFDYDLVALADKKPTTVLFKFTRCPNQDNMDACSVYPPFRTKAMCSMLTAKNEIWSSMISCFAPTPGCPIKKGVYHGTNCSVDMEAFRFFPLTSGFFLLEIEVMDDNKKQIFCTRSGGYVM